MAKWRPVLICCTCSQFPSCRVPRFPSTLRCTAAQMTNPRLNARTMTLANDANASVNLHPEYQSVIRVRKDLWPFKGNCDSLSLSLWPSVSSLCGEAIILWDSSSCFMVLLEATEAYERWHKMRGTQRRNIVSLDEAVLGQILVNETINTLHFCGQ